jgi:hypothetical protein
MDRCCAQAKKKKKDNRINTPQSKELLASAYDVCIAVVCFSSSALQMKRQPSIRITLEAVLHTRQGWWKIGQGGAPQLLRKIVIYLLIIPIVFPLLGIVSIFLILLPLWRRGCKDAIHK